MPDGADVKRSAASALRRAGRERLGPLGFRSVSSSPRQWLADFGWWIVNVEFQASKNEVASFLNAGIQYLWFVRDHRIFGGVGPQPHRYSIPGHGDIARLFGSPEQIARAADAVGLAAVGAAIGLIEPRRDTAAHLRLIARQRGTGWRRRLLDPYDLLDRAIARALLGDSAGASGDFGAVQREAGDAHEWQRELGNEARALQQLATDPARLRAAIGERIATTRGLLELGSGGDVPLLDIEVPGSS